MSSQKNMKHGEHEERGGCAARRSLVRHAAHEAPMPAQS